MLATWLTLWASIIKTTCYQSCYIEISDGKAYYITSSIYSSLLASITHEQKIIAILIAANIEAEALNFVTENRLARIWL